MIFQEETKDKTGDSAKRTQLSHKKQQMAEKSGPSRALPRSPRPVSLYYAVTSGDDTSMPYHFFKIKFSSAEKLEKKTDVLLIL